MRRVAAVILLVSLSAVPVFAETPDARAVALRTKRTEAVIRLVRGLLIERKLDEARKILESERARIDRTVATRTLSVDDAKMLYFLGIVEEMSGSTVKRDAVFARVALECAAVQEAVGRITDRQLAESRENLAAHGEAARSGPQGGDRRAPHGGRHCHA